MSRRAHARSEKLAQLRTEADANLERAEKAEASAKVRQLVLCLHGSARAPRALSSLAVAAQANAHRRKPTRSCCSASRRSRRCNTSCPRPRRRSRRPRARRRAIRPRAPTRARTRRPTRACCARLPCSSRSSTRRTRTCARRRTSCARSMSGPSTLSVRSSGSRPSGMRALAARAGDRRG